MKVNAADFLGKRQLEVTRATNGYALVVTQPVFVKTIDELKQLVTEEPGQWQLSQDVFDADSNLVFGAYTTLDESNLQVHRGNEPRVQFRFTPTTIPSNANIASWRRGMDGCIITKFSSPATTPPGMHAVETPPVSDQLQAMILQVQQALPNVLALTNQNLPPCWTTPRTPRRISTPRSLRARPLLTNFAVLSAQLREPGGLGVWMLGTNGAQQTQSVVANVDTNLLLLSLTLDHLADITSNLNAQVQANTNMLGVVSKTVGDADDFVQGLKRHWLFRSAFKKENKGNTNAPPGNSLSPRMR